MTDTRAHIQHYSVAEEPRFPWLHVGQVLGYPGRVWRHRGLVWNFFRRDLLGRFRGSFLGIFWVLIQPLFLFALYFLVFGFLFGPKIGPQGPDVSFAFYLFSGIIAWTAFTEGSTRACSSVVDNGNLVKKVKFPSELLPVHLVAVALLVYLVGATILLVSGLAFGAVHLSEAILALPLLLVVQAAFTLGVGLFLAMLQVFMRDTSHLYALVSQAWFFLSPIFWPPGFMRVQLGDWALDVARLNPMYPLIQAHRAVLGVGDLRVWAVPEQGNPGFVAVPESLWSNLGLAAAWAAFFLVLGHTAFMAKRRKFADLV